MFLRKKNKYIILCLATMVIGLSLFGLVLFGSFGRAYATGGEAVGDIIKASDMQASSATYNPGDTVTFGKYPQSAFDVTIKTSDAVAVKNLKNALTTAGVIVRAIDCVQFGTLTSGVYKRTEMFAVNSTNLAYFYTKYNTTTNTLTTEDTRKVSTSNPGGTITKTYSNLTYNSISKEYAYNGVTTAVEVVGKSYKATFDNGVTYDSITGYYTYNSSEYYRTIKHDNSSTTPDVWFMVEPIEWRVVGNDSNSNKLKLLSEKVLDSMMPQGTFTNEGDAVSSPLTAWNNLKTTAFLNGTDNIINGSYKANYDTKEHGYLSFFHSAFSTAQQGCLEGQTVGGENYKVSLLSSSEATYYNVGNVFKIDDVNIFKTTVTGLASAHLASSSYWRPQTGYINSGTYYSSNHYDCSNYGLRPTILLNATVTSMSDGNVLKKKIETTTYISQNTIDALKALKAPSWTKTMDSYLYFGKYPQSKVLSPATALTDAGVIVRAIDCVQFGTFTNNVYERTLSYTRSASTTSTITFTYTSTNDGTNSGILAGNAIVAGKTVTKNSETSYTYGDITATVALRANKSYKVTFDNGVTYDSVTGYYTHNNSEYYRTLTGSSFNTTDNGKDAWFLVEPIKWKIMSKSGTNYKLLSVNNLDCIYSHPTFNYNMQYQFLNGGKHNSTYNYNPTDEGYMGANSFYYSAFNDEEKLCLAGTPKVSLLTYSELRGTSSSALGSFDDSKSISSDLAICHGGQKGTEYGYWQIQGRYVDENGIASSFSSYSTKYALRPTITLDTSKVLYGRVESTSAGEKTYIVGRCQDEDNTVVIDSSIEQEGENYKITYSTAGCEGKTISLIVRNQDKALVAGFYSIETGNDKTISFNKSILDGSGYIINFYSNVSQSNVDIFKTPVGSLVKGSSGAKEVTIQWDNGTLIRKEYVLAGQKLVNPMTPDNITVDGVQKGFVKWTKIAPTDVSGDVQLSARASYNFDDAVNNGFTLYAAYSNAYNLTYKTLGDSGYTDVVKTMTAECAITGEDKIEGIVPDSLASQIEFKYWTSDEEAYAESGGVNPNTFFYQDGGKATSNMPEEFDFASGISRDTTLYPVYAYKQYGVTFYTGEVVPGSSCDDYYGSDATNTQVTYNYGETIVRDNRISCPASADGFEFVGWSQSATSYIPYGESQVTSAGTVLYPYYTRNHYTVTAISNNYATIVILEVDANSYEGDIVSNLDGDNIGDQTVDTYHGRTFYFSVKPKDNYNKTQIVYSLLNIYRVIGEETVSAGSWCSASTYIPTDSEDNTYYFKIENVENDFCIKVVELSENYNTITVTVPTSGGEDFTVLINGVAYTGTVSGGNATYIGGSMGAYSVAIRYNGSSCDQRLADLIGKITIVGTTETFARQGNVLILSSEDPLTDDITITLTSWDLALNQYTVGYKYFDGTGTATTKYWNGTSFDSIASTTVDNCSLAEHGSEVTIPASCPVETYIKDGIKYTFSGWDTNGDGEYEEDDNSFVITQNRVINAVYTPTQLYTVSYRYYVVNTTTTPTTATRQVRYWDVDNIMFKDNSNVGIVDKDTNITIASQADAQAQMFYSSDGKVKYTFVGWDTNGDGVYDESDSRELLVTSDMLIDAIYSESYLVVVDNNEALNANISSATTQATERFIIPESNKTYYWVKFGEAINVQVVVKTGFRAIFDISCIKVTSNVPSGHTISYAIGDSSTDAGEYLISNVTCPITISCRTLPTATYDVKVTVDNVVIPSTNVYINGINHSGNTAKVADNASVTIIAIASSRYSQAFERSEGIINCTATIGGDSYTLTPVLSGTTITLSIPASDVVGEIVVNITSSASLNTYNVTFNYFDNNGIYSTHSENVGHGDTIDSPEVTGYTAHPYTYTFSKWTTSAGDWDQSTPIEEDVIITAQYTSVACSYEVTLTTNDYATISCVGESDDTRAYDISGDSLLVPYEGALFIKVVVGDTYRSSGFGPDDLILTNSLEEGNPHATYVLDTSDSRNNPENAANGIYYYKIEHVRNNFSVECADLSKTRYAVSVNITEPTTVPTPTNNSLIQVAIGGASYNNNTVKLDNNAVVNIVITLAKDYNNDQNYNNLFNAIVNGGYSKNKHDTTQTVDGITYDKCIVIGPITVDRDISITIDAFNLTHNPCTVTLKNGDTPFGSFQYAYGGSLSISNETLETLAGYSSVPTQDEDDQYTYTFDCWGVEGYSADTGSISVIRDIVLYAKFTRALRTYTVTLPTGGTKYTIEHYSNTDGKVAYGCTYTFLVKVNSGYSQAIPSPTSDFGGIVRGGAELNLNEGMHFFYISNVTQDISITLDDTAWALNSYNIMFNYYDEDSDTWIEYGNDTPQKVQLVEYNSHASKPTAPTALGKTFVEWYADKDYISVYDFATSVRGNISLYARFVTDNYVVKVVGQTGSIENVLLNKTFEMRSELVSIDIPEDIQDEVIRAYTGLVYDRAEAPKITFRINKFYKNALGEKVTIGEVNFDNLKVIALPKGGTPSVLVGTSDVDGDGFGYIEYLNIQITADTEIYISDVEDVVLNVTFLKSYNNEEIDWSELYNSEPQYNYNDVIIRPDKTGKDFGEENVFGDKFKFMGFFYKIDDETNTAREEDRVTFGTDSITFSTTIYALIEPIYYSVTFEYNNTSKVVKVAYGEKVREPSLSDEELGIASNEQKIGWETVGGYAFDFGTTLDDACDCADHTLRTMTLALVKGIKQFSITYYDKDNQIIGESDTLDYGSHVTAPADPIVEGYNFVGWKTTGDRGGDNFAFTTTEITEDINLYATYERIFVTATFYIDGAKVGEKTVEYGASIPESEWPTIPSKTGYDQATPSWDKSEEQLTELKSNIIVNAVYTINKYTINIVQNGKVINTLTYNYGENISVDVLPDSNILYDFAYNRGLLVNVNDNRDIVIKKVFSGMFYYIIFGSIAFVGVTALVALIIVKKVTTAKYNEKKAKEITQKLEKLKQKDIGKE